MKTAEKPKDLSIGVIVPAGLELCRQILVGVRSACEEAALRVHVISDTAALPEGFRIDQSRMPPLAGVVAHISTESDFDQARMFSPVVVGTSNRSRTTAQPRVINDEEVIGRMGAEYLISLGFRHLVFLNKRSMHYSRERCEGFNRAALEANAHCQVISFSASHEMQKIIGGLMRQPPPLGVMADSDMSARAFLEQFPDLREWVPHRVAVLGVDDDSLQNALSPIGLSSVRTGGQEIGFEAGRLVMRLHAGETVPPHPIRIRPVRVVERASTSVLAIEDPHVLKTVRLLRDRVAEFRTVGDLVEAVGIHRRTLEMRFSKTLHRTLAAELTHARINAARELLEATNLTVAEIAEKVGYPEYRLLTLAFRRVCGETPSAYRKRVRKA